jgi:hypothetical protein
LDDLLKFMQARSFLRVQWLLIRRIHLALVITEILAGEQPDIERIRLSASSQPVLQTT